MVRLKRETGTVAPKPQCSPGRGKLTDLKDWVRGRIAAEPDLTIDEPALTTGLRVQRSSAGRAVGH